MWEQASSDMTIPEDSTRRFSDRYETEVYLGPV